MTSNELLKQLKSDLLVTSFVFIDNTESLSQILVSPAPSVAIELFYIQKENQTYGKNQRQIMCLHESRCLFCNIHSIVLISDGNKSPPTQRPSCINI